MQLSRRQMLIGAAAAFAAEPVIDIHQHTHYHGRSNGDLIAHQRALGATTTVLLPAGSRYGLAANAHGNDSVMALARAHPREFIFFANELPNIDEAPAVIRSVLRQGGRGIGEQKFPVDADSKFIQRVCDVARDFNVPVLLHFEHDVYNFGFDRFHRVLEKYPQVTFIGHAQTWWGNIDAEHEQKVMYPKGRVTPGGLTDRYLRDYPNMYGDLSAGSGLNALLRDEEHTREFLDRHRNKLLYGSDCADAEGRGPKCSGAQCLAAVRRLAPDAAAVRSILHDNAARLLRLK